MLSYRHLLIVVIIILSGIPLSSQEIEGTVVRAKIIGSDTVPVFKLSQVIVVGDRIFESRREERRHSRLVRNVKAAYPYAKLAGMKFEKYNQKLQEVESEAEKRHMMRQIEDELLEEFEDDLRSLTFSQGLILIKLIDRETQHTSYDVLKDFRGMFRAVFWQSLGRIFGYDLRTEYEPYGEDRMIEHIVILIEEGAI